ncbi:hypothetical protein CMV16_21930 [Peribacillus simplex]|nr:hypothetical protein CMV16_21930 [Peribacillus simplex]
MTIENYEDRARKILEEALYAFLKESSQDQLLHEAAIRFSSILRIPEPFRELVLTEISNFRDRWNNEWFDVIMKELINKHMDTEKAKKSSSDNLSAFVKNF